MMTRSRSRGMQDIDLNIEPPRGTLNHDTLSIHTSSNHGLPTQGVTTPPTIDVEALDDEVIVYSSLRASADNNYIRSRQRILAVDLESDEMSASYRCKRLPTNQRLEVEGSSTSKRKKAPGVMPLPPPPPKEATFICPVCMCSISDEMSTKCGHIFCKRCIETAISITATCPVCRKELTAEDIFKVYLPASIMV